MEIGEFITNVLSINDLASIPFTYLESPSQASLSSIESTWRKEGALVTRSNDKTGIWLFGKTPDDDALPLSSIRISGEELIEAQGTRLAIKQKGTFESTSIWQTARSLAPPPSSQGILSSLSTFTDSAVRIAQALNTKAVQSNASPVVSQESGTTATSTKGESWSPIDQNVLPRNIHEHFVAAVLASLSYGLCHRHGFVALNARTMILPEAVVTSGNDSDGPRNLESNCDALLMVSLDVHLTSLGSLIVKASPVRSLDFFSILSANFRDDQSNATTNGATLYLAPIGRIAKYYDSEIGEDGSSKIPLLQSSEERYIAHNPHLKHTIHRWKQRSSRWLENKGLASDTFEIDGWIMVQIFLYPSDIGDLTENEDGLYTPEEKLVTIPWPARLCFRRRSMFPSNDKFSKLVGGHDPLAFAERWFMSKVDRELTIAKRKKEREAAAAAAVVAQADSEARLYASNHYSPVALRRASIVGAVYPTPPDGLPIGATPSFDGNVSTPGYPNTQLPQIEGEQLAAPKGEPEDPDGNLFESTESKRDQANTSLDFTDSGGDLFGDMGGEDLFGENDITDADFSFFDEPDILEDKEDNNVEVDEISSHTVKLKAEKNSADHFQDLTEGNRTDIEMHDQHMAPIPAHGVEQSTLPEAKAEERDLESVNQILLVLSDSQLEPKIADPPLSPELVFQRLSIAGIGPEDSRRPNLRDLRLSVFEGLPFDKSLSHFGEKYGAQGRFTSSFSMKTLPKMTATLPNTGYLNKRRKTASNSTDIVGGVVRFHPQMINLQASSEHDDNHSDVESPTRSRGSSIPSDQDDTSNTTDEGHPSFPATLKRKRGLDESTDGNVILSSAQDLNVEHDQSSGSAETLDSLDPAILDPDPADWSFARFLSQPTPRPGTDTLEDVAYIAAAQILSDQAISRTMILRELVDDESVDKTHRHDAYSNIANLVHEKLASAMKDCFDRTTECSLSTFIDIQGQQPIGQLNRLPPRPMPQTNALHRPEALRLKAIFPLPAPHLQVRRADSKLTVLPSAIPFWESLGLGPSKGVKDVSAVCIYADGEGMADNVDVFLEHIRNAYESGKLGSHDRFIHAEISGGLVPVDFGEGPNLSVADHQAVLSRITETSTKLGALFASGSVQDTNIVVYYLYDPSNADLLVSICSSFHDLFRVYKERLAADKSPTVNELVLQLVPMDFVASRISLVVPLPSIYSRLAMEVYDRCVDVKSGTASPSIVLESPLPRNIDFKLTPNASASLLQENSVMHIAYAQSLDDRWITAAWTDNTGTQQANVSYCLGRKNRPLTMSFSSIAHEIWETTLEILSVRKVHWRIMIVKSGVMETFEVDFWKGLAITESKAQISLTLITVDTSPSLTLLPPSASVPPSTLTVPSLFYTTPVSTPSASVISPNQDQSGNPQTPHSHPPTNALTPGGGTEGGELKIEPDATLIDITDQTWGVALSHRLNNSRSLLDFNPALFSGYLIKRSGTTTSSPPVVLEVNLVQSDMNSRLYEPMLREILSYYRGLATLARARGVTGGGDGRPWHIAAAEKGIAVLGLLM